MFARVTHARYPSEQHAAGMEVVVEALLPALRLAPGYRGCLLLADGKPGSCLALVLWETEEAADAAAAGRDVAAAYVTLAKGGLAIESRKMYEVVVHDQVRRRA
jgi:heme-degrading monooxygenase HmoA